MKHRLSENGLKWVELRWVSLIFCFCCFARGISRCPPRPHSKAQWFAGVGRFISLNMGQQASAQLGSSSNLEASGTNLVCSSKRIEQSFNQIMLVCHYLKGITCCFFGKVGEVCFTDYSTRCFAQICLVLCLFDIIPWKNTLAPRHSRDSCVESWGSRSFHRQALSQWPGYFPRRSVFFGPTFFSYSQEHSEWKSYTSNYIAHLLA